VNLLGLAMVGTAVALGATAQQKKRRLIKEILDDELQTAYVEGSALRTDLVNALEKKLSLNDLAMLMAVIRLRRSPGFPGLIDRQQ